MRRESRRSDTSSKAASSSGCQRWPNTKQSSSCTAGSGGPPPRCTISASARGRPRSSVSKVAYMPRNWRSAAGGTEGSVQAHSSHGRRSVTPVLRNRA